MTNFVIDASAWVEYLRGTSVGEKVKRVMENGKNQVFTSSVTVAEVISVVKRKSEAVDRVRDVLRSWATIIAADANIAQDAGELHAEMRKKIKDFGLADAFVAVLAQETQSKILTTDSHFKGFKGAILLDHL